MAQPIQPNALHDSARKLVSAALRHLRDAETLLEAEPSSPDGAFYLAGYAPELIRKATLSERWLDQAIGHISEATYDHDAGTTGALSHKGAAALELALELDPIAHRYAHQDLTPLLAMKWSTRARYQPTSTHDKATARSLLDEARRITDEIVVDMWADGRFTGTRTPW